MDYTDEMSEFKECSICYRPYDSNQIVPRLLNCQHTFCTPCLKNLRKTVITNLRYVVKCPVCRSEHYLKSGDEVPKNRFIIAFLNQLTKSNANKLNNLEESNLSSVRPTSVVESNQATPPVKQHHNEPKIWDIVTYLRQLFDDIDTNHDSLITSGELGEALARGMPGSKFNQNTIILLLEKYDQNKDGKIDFAEFETLFDYINQLYEAFVHTDKNFSGTIDSYELLVDLQKRSNQQISNHFINTINKKFNELNIQSNSINFDNYCHIVIRFEHLQSIYNNSVKIEKFEDFLNHRLFMKHYLNI